ncbi:MAG: FAD-binding protein [Candidatus Rokubacteria bacterium]|nr:FAD-binding protein [Candidatus Rokubacteria bacterium]
MRTKTPMSRAGAANGKAGSDLERELRRVVEGEVRFDDYSRLLYATDASIYQVEPIGVVLPRTADDVRAVLELANRYNVPVLPRGGGTSLAGQAVNHAVVLDFSRFMDRVLEVNRDERWCRVEPGLVQDELNAHVRPLGLLFGPDTSTSNRATVGGMCGNNSAGAHSIAYGKTIDHVLELRCLLADGSEVVLRDLALEELEAKGRGNGLEGQIYREVRRLVAQHGDEIRARYPKILRRVSGYNLDEFVKDQPFGLHRLAVGSEGTLVVVVEMKLGLVPKPRYTALDVVHYASLEAALESSPDILTTGPYAVELTDKLILDLARENLEQRRRMGFVEGDPQAIMLVEYAGESEVEVRSKVTAFEALRARKGIGYAGHVAVDPAEQQSIWKLRKAGLGLLLGLKGDRKPIAFVEDTAVDPAKLPAFIARFRDVLARHGAAAGYYGHCSVGCLHIRPLINLKEAAGVRQMQAIAEEITALVLEVGGALSGEHGDGRARSPFNERLYGPRLYDAFRQVKRAFDPKGLLNPGNIVDAPPMTEHLRYGPGSTSWEPETLLDFSAQGGFAAAVEMCSGIGVCRKKLEGTMCPSYMATLDEEHSTRGRANALRAVLSGKVPASDFTGRRLYEVLDLCLECKACKAECPANVDMAKLKYEFLAHYYRAHGLPLRNRLFGHIHRLARLGSALAPVSNWIARSAPNRWLLRSLCGIDRRRPLPAFAGTPFTAWFARHRPGGAGERGTVVLFHDTFNTYQTPDVAIAATQLLEAAGYRVFLPERRCCGRPMISKGMLAEARDSAAYNVARLAGFARQGLPIVGLEPSCLLTLRDEYVDLLRSEDARLVARQSLLLDEFLQRAWASGGRPAFSGHGRKALLHGHCHQKALVGTGPTVGVLEAAGYAVTEIDAGCCGMAGSFGFEAEHYDLSLAIAARRLVPAVKAAAHDVAVCAPGISCRQQIEHTTGRRPKHPAELLWEALSR